MVSTRAILASCALVSFLILWLSSGSDKVTLNTHLALSERVAQLEATCGQKGKSPAVGSFVSLPPMIFKDLKHGTSWCSQWLDGPTCWFARAVAVPTDMVVTQLALSSDDQADSDTMIKLALFEGDPTTQSDAIWESERVPMPPYHVRVLPVTPGLRVDAGDSLYMVGQEGNGDVEVTATLSGYSVR